MSRARIPERPRGGSRFRRKLKGQSRSHACLLCVMTLVPTPLLATWRPSERRRSGLSQVDRGKSQGGYQNCLGSSFGFSPCLPLVHEHPFGDPTVSPSSTHTTGDLPRDESSFFFSERGTPPEAPATVYGPAETFLEKHRGEPQDTQYGKLSSQRPFSPSLNMFGQSSSWKTLEIQEYFAVAQGEAREEERFLLGRPASSRPLAGGLFFFPPSA